jgi:hypothetical protein
MINSIGDFREMRSVIDRSISHYLKVHRLHPMVKLLNYVVMVRCIVSKGIVNPKKSSIIVSKGDAVLT